jgi:LacI family transcriptional regulator
VSVLCRERLARGPRPDAIFCTNGPTGLGALRALRDAGLKTPEDIAFATVDELMADDLFYPSITTVVQPALDIGGTAAEILLNRIENTAKSEESVMVRLRPGLKVGDSSRGRVRAH